MEQNLNKTGLCGDCVGDGWAILGRNGVERKKIEGQERSGLKRNRELAARFGS